MKGINLIGKIYKTGITRKYLKGYRIKNKVKSNFGGITENYIYLYVENDEIVIEFDRSILIAKRDNTIIKKNEFKMIGNMSSKINKIGNPNCNKALNFKNKYHKNEYILSVVLKEVNNKKVEQIINIYVIPSVYNNKEYFEIILDEIDNIPITIKTTKEIEVY